MDTVVRPIGRVFVQHGEEETSGVALGCVLTAWRRSGPAGHCGRGVPPGEA